MPKFTLDMFLRRMNEVPMGSFIKVIDTDQATHQPIEKEIVDVEVQYDTKNTVVVVKIK